MPGPSAFIRQQCPNATLENDGLMTKEQAQLVAAGGSGGLPDPSAMTSGTVPVVVDGLWTYRQLTSDDLAAAFSVSASFTGTGTVEVGASVASFGVTASYPNGAPGSASLASGASSQALSSPYTSGTLAGPFTSATPNASQTVTLSAVRAGVTRTASDARTYRARSFHGAATPGTLNEAFIEALPSSGLTSGYTGTYAIGALGGTKRAYLSIPASYGTPASFKDATTGFSVPFSVVATVDVTNALGVTLSYSLWASDEILNAAFSLQVT